MKTILKLENINMKYEEDKILNDINYNFNKGKVYGLIGKNGAGKTTLLKIIMGIIKENTGKVFVNNKDTNELDYLDIEATFIMDAPIFYNDLTVEEHMLLICSSMGINRKDAKYKVKELLEKLKLEKYKKHFPYSLSKGTAQRVNIALGMLRNEEIILMDEPFNALDPVQVSIVENIVLDLKKDERTLIISSHDIDSLESICDVYLILKEGRIIEYMPSELSKEQISKLIGDDYEK